MPGRGSGWNPRGPGWSRPFPRSRTGPEPEAITHGGDAAPRGCAVTASAGRSWLVEVSWHLLLRAAGRAAKAPIGVEGRRVGSPRRSHKSATALGLQGTGKTGASRGHAQRMVTKCQCAPRAGTLGWRGPGQARSRLGLVLDWAAGAPPVGRDRGRGPCPAPRGWSPLNHGPSESRARAGTVPHPCAPLSPSLFPTPPPTPPLCQSPVCSLYP